MTPFTYFRIAATLVEGFTQARKVRADGVVTTQEMLEVAIALAEKSEIDTLILAHPGTAPTLEVLSGLLKEAHLLAAGGEEVTFGHVLRSALSAVQQKGMSEHPVSKVF
ncbi:MAG: hypothetical protein HW380_2555 [Magnetococcales bacterium]|nr:hypothetical protein [Magnetococcales bacterium]